MWLEIIWFIDIPWEALVVTRVALRSSLSSGICHCSFQVQVKKPLLASQEMLLQPESELPKALSPFQLQGSKFAR